jgi:hypothetical protein
MAMPAAKPINPPRRADSPLLKPSSSFLVSVVAVFEDEEVAPFADVVVVVVVVTV